MGHRQGFPAVSPESRTLGGGGGHDSSVERAVVFKPEGEHFDSQCWQTTGVCDTDGRTLGASVSTKNFPKGINKVCSNFYYGLYMVYRALVMRVKAQHTACSLSQGLIQDLSWPDPNHQQLVKRCLWCSLYQIRWHDIPQTKCQFLCQTQLSQGISISFCQSGQTSR